MIPEIGIPDWLSSTQIWGIIYYLYVIPEIGILDWLSSTPNWVSSTPNLGNNVVYVSCGDDHTGFITSTGDIYTFGNNNYGQLGFRF